MPSPTARLLNGVPMPLLVIGPDHFIAEANLAAQELFPKADGLIGRHHGLLIARPTFWRRLTGRCTGPRRLWCALSPPVPAMTGCMR